jgi:hypothetical protein
LEVYKLALNIEKDICISTSGYCKARGHLSLVAIKNMTKDIGKKDEKRIDVKWKFRGRNIYLVDGTTITMADTKANQKEYPQPSFQKEGLGFPICRLVHTFLHNSNLTTHHSPNLLFKLKKLINIINLQNIHHLQKDPKPS